MTPPPLSPSPLRNSARHGQRESSSTPQRPMNRLQRAGSLRFGAGNCLTEPGIVCFPVAPARRTNLCPTAATGKQYEASEGVLAAPDRSEPMRGRPATPHIPNHPQYFNHKDAI